MHGVYDIAYSTSYHHDVLCMVTERLRVTSRRVYMRNAALLLAWRVHVETKLHNGTAGKAGVCERGRRIKRESFTELG